MSPRAARARIVVLSQSRAIADGLARAAPGVDVETVSGARELHARGDEPAAVLLLDAAVDLAELQRASERLGGSRPATILLVDEYAPASLRLLLSLDADTLALRSASGEELAGLVDDVRRSRRPRAGELTPSPFDGFVGQSAWLRDLCRVLPRIARSEGSVLITGETGTGKELVARALHRLSMRRHGPFIAVNCGALPESLVESELFGYERGAFTGAAHAKEGRFELAHGGTLFLDEIGELSEPAQVKLLRALQERTIERVGGTQARPVDVRVIAATNRDVSAGATGRLRSDLVFRLQVFSLHLPPLRERRDDVLPLWQRFTDEAARARRRGALLTSPVVTSALLAYDWPGNVRELANAAQHAATLADEVVEPTHLPPALARVQPADEDPVLRIPPGMTLKDLERIAILDTLRATGGIRRAAEVLGISRRTLQYRLRDYREQGYLPKDVLDEPADGPPPSTRRARVLLAEDDDDVRYALERLLSRAGYEVVAVHSGSAVLEHVGAALLLKRWQEAPDVIVTDVRMPGVTGLELLEGVRQSGWQVPVVVVTAFGDAQLRARAMALGATAFLDKPLDGPELEQAVAAALQASAA